MFQLVASIIPAQVQHGVSIRLRPCVRALRNGSTSSAISVWFKKSSPKLKSIRQMPGIPILPLVGSWPFLWMNKDWNPKKLPEFTEKCFEKYGPIFKIDHPGSGKQVFIKNIADIRTTLMDRHILKNPQRVQFQALENIRNEELKRMFSTAGMTFTSGDDWLRVRKIFNQWLVGSKNMPLESALVDEVTQEFINRIRTIRNPVTNEVPENFLFEISRWALQAMTNSLMGYRLKNLNDDAVEGDMERDIVLHSAIGTNSLFDIKYSFPIWKLVKTRKYRALQSAMTTNLRLVNQMIDECLARVIANPSEQKDTLLKLAAQHDSLRSGDLYSTIHDCIGAGIEVTPQHAAKVMYCLAKHPEVQKQLQTQVDEHVKPDQELLSTDLRKMPYLKAVVRESLRYLPSALVTSRFVNQPLVLHDYVIPPGWSVTIPLVTSASDEKVVTKPNKFLPERFVGRNHLRPENFSYIPFSFGVRQCIGRNLADIILENLAARLSQNFDISYNYPDLKNVCRVTARLDGHFKFTFKDRIRQA